MIELLATAALGWSAAVAGMAAFEPEQNCPADHVSGEWLAGLEDVRATTAADTRYRLLQPTDTSGPREVLVDFILRVEHMHDLFVGTLDAHLASDRLYLSHEERRAIRESRVLVENIAQAFEFEQLPRAMQSFEYRERMILTLKDVLDRIPLPPLEEIPDASEIAATGQTRWRVPGTPIEIHRAGPGEYKGQWRFSAGTILQLPQIREQASGLPYINCHTAGYLQSFKHSAYGLKKLIPYRWTVAFPDWSRTLILDQPTWRWLGLALLLAIGAAAVSLLRRLRWRRRPDPEGESLMSLWGAAVVPAGVAVLLVFIREFSTHQLRFSAPVYAPMMIMLTALLYLSVIWLIWKASRAISESVIRSQGRVSWGIDGQLIRLVSRLFAIILITTILIEGAARIGLPAYSMVAGLGIGGLAIALAARDSIANLVSSLTIMMEKPFRVGHRVKVGDIEGTVEAVGFRSTLIRTRYGSLVSVPSSKMTESVIDNLGARRYRRFTTTISVTYDTPPDRLMCFVEAIREIVLAHPRTVHEDFQVYVQDLAESSIDILLHVFLRVGDWPSELREREDLIVRIIRCAGELGVQFAFPTRTVHVAELPASPSQPEAS